MKSQPEMSLYNIIERLQRQLERQGLSTQAADRTIAVAVRQLATR